MAKEVGSIQDALFYREVFQSMAHIAAGATVAYMTGDAYGAAKGASGLLAGLLTYANSAMINYSFN